MSLGWDRQSPPSVEGLIYRHGMAGGFYLEKEKIALHFSHDGGRVYPTQPPRLARHSQGTAAARARIGRSGVSRHSSAASNVSVVLFCEPARPDVNVL